MECSAVLLKLFTCQKEVIHELLWALIFKNLLEEAKIYE